MREDPWQILGIERDAGVEQVRRAYATQIKRTRPDDDPEGFQRLRDAYDFLLALAAQAPALPVAAAVEDPAPRIEAAATGDVGDGVRAPEIVAREILDACSPAQFDPDTVRHLVVALPDLVPLYMRHVTGVALAQYIAEGVTVSPHAIVLLAELFDWNDVTVVRANPVFHDPRFVERMQRAMRGSRPSTRQHSTPPNVGFGLLAVLLIGASNLMREVQRRLHDAGDSASFLRGDADLATVAGLVLAAVVLGVLEMRWHGMEMSAAARRWRWAARGLLGGVVVVGALYFIGRP